MNGDFISFFAIIYYWIQGNKILHGGGIERGRLSTLFCYQASDELPHFMPSLEHLARQIYYLVSYSQPSNAQALDLNLAGLQM